MTHDDSNGYESIANIYIAGRGTRSRVDDSISARFVRACADAFTAPAQVVEWLDAMTGRPSQSLGAQAYERLLRDSRLTLVAESQDEGDNHYYFAEKR